MSVFGKENRAGRLHSIIAEGELALLNFKGSDYVNNLFEYSVEAVSQRDNLHFSDIMGSHASIEIISFGEIKTYDGIVCDFCYVGEFDGGFKYSFTLRPWLWLASKRRNQRIFHEKTVLEIVAEIFDEYQFMGSKIYALETSRDFPVQEYTVQYRETDLEFVRRQLERHAISFHFRHQMGEHTLVLTTDPLTHADVGSRKVKTYKGEQVDDEEHFWAWHVESRIATGAVRTTDYNFKSPTQLMEALAMGEPVDQVGLIESFDYPGDYLNNDEGREKARLRESQERGSGVRHRAVGNCSSVSSGDRLTVVDAVKGADPIEFICVKATHTFMTEAYSTVAKGGENLNFTGNYIFLPVTEPLASPRRSLPAIVHGPQTAIVVGEDEIDCDEYGRILVRFHWDLLAQHSMRCRVSQNWSGGNWGGLVIPRVGMEVVVEFLEGDPDKPLVTGTVYNGVNGTPYRLPEGRTKAVWRSKTHNQDEGFNEISFEDKSNGEEILIHAERHKIELVPSVSTEVVGGGRGNFQEIDQHIDIATSLTKRRMPDTQNGLDSLTDESKRSAAERFKVRR